MKNKVELIGYYGSDLEVATAAWTSTSRELTEDKRQPERQLKLLKMLASENHHTPFERPYLHFLITADTASHIHIIKHRIGISVNGESARYRELKEDKALVPHDWPADMREMLEQHNSESFNRYHQALTALVASGMDRKRAKESARFFLPYSNQLVLDTSMNLRAFFHFQGLRNSEHAQLEIREIAQEMLRLVKNTGSFNLSLEAFGY
jgi:thymidylate synthase (FAD)